MKETQTTRDQNQELYIGLLRLHVLHHSAERPIFGLGMIQELGRHGYHLGPGTIHPLLHAMEIRGWLTSEQRLANGHKGRVYSATPCRPKSPRPGPPICPGIVRGNV